jgi:hypothetical protein
VAQASVCGLAVTTAFRLSEKTKRAPKEKGRAEARPLHKSICSLTGTPVPCPYSIRSVRIRPKLQIERAIHKPVRAADYIAWHDPHTIAG